MAKGNLKEGIVRLYVRLERDDDTCIAYRIEGPAEYIGPCTTLARRCEDNRWRLFDNRYGEEEPGSGDLSCGDGFQNREKAKEILEEFHIRWGLVAIIYSALTDETNPVSKVMIINETVSPPQIVEYTPDTFFSRETVKT